MDKSSSLYQPYTYDNSSTHEVKEAKQTHTAYDNFEPSAMPTNEASYHEAWLNLSKFKHVRAPETNFLVSQR